MTDSDLEQIENELNIVLSDGYKKAVLKNPFRNKDIYFAVHSFLCDDCELLIKKNLLLRQYGYDSMIWPDNYFVFGFNSKNHKSYLFVNLKNRKQDLIYMITEAKKFNPKKIGHLKHFNNFDDFIKRYKMLQEIANIK